MRSRLQIMSTFRQIVVNLPKIYHVYRHNRNRTTLIPQISKHIITILIRFFASTSTSRQNGVYFLFRRSNSQVYYYSVVRATIYTLFNNSNCSRASRKLANYRVRSRQFTLKKILHTWPAVQKNDFSHIPRHSNLRSSHLQANEPRNRVMYGRFSHANLHSAASKLL